ncbi:MAG: csrA [Firmicutes bacterium]|nr:csrA [Bacillota bacterium]
MLALTRKVGERLVIDDNIIITIVDTKGENIRLAIEAPKEIKIYRGELYDAIVAENKQAATPAQDGILDVLKDIKARKP